MVSFEVYTMKPKSAFGLETGRMMLEELRKMGIVKLPVDHAKDKMIADAIKTLEIQQVIAEETNRHGYRKPTHDDYPYPSEWDLGKYVT
jgi:hypothetical protein